MKRKLKEFIKEEYKFILLMIGIMLVCYLKLPFYISTTGGTINITNRVEMEGYKNNKGSLNMLYVSEYRATPLTYLLAKIRKLEITKKDDLIISDETLKEAEIRNRIMRDNSLDIAKMVSYKRAGKDIKVVGKKMVVIATEEGKDIKIGDIILRIDDKICNNSNEIRKIINSKEKGDILKVTILRDNKELDISAKIEVENGVKVIGIVVIDDFDYELNPNINIKFKNRETGSSGGLMLTLTIYNAISGEDIIKGRNIAGTGTIDINGNVGEIGGVKYKIMGAHKDKVDLVFVPRANYEEALNTKKKYNYDLDIIMVENIDDAINYLKNTK